MLLQLLWLSDSSITPMISIALSSSRTTFFLCSGKWFIGETCLVGGNWPRLNFFLKSGEKKISCCRKMLRKRKLKKRKWLFRIQRLFRMLLGFTEETPKKENKQVRHSEDLRQILLDATVISLHKLYLILTELLLFTALYSLLLGRTI